MARTLYAIASELPGDNPGEWVPAGIEYLHATSEIEARRAFLRHPEHRGRRIVAAGPTVGVFARETSDGKNVILYT